MKSLLEIRIKNNSYNMTKREKEISERLLQENFEFNKLSITRLAKKIGASVSAINRWCNKLGFEGYKDFIASIKSQQKFDTNYSHLENETSKDIVYSISTTESTFRYSELMLVLKEIKKGKEIIFYGESFTFLQSEYYARLLRKINVRTSILNVASDISLILPNENAIHIFVSMSGKNPNVKRAFEKLTDNNQKMFTVSISANKTTNISNKVNAELHGFFYQSIDIDNYELPIVAKLTTDYILMQLFIHIYMDDEPKYNKIIKNIAKEKS